jgi:CRP-like cAMP-binding protein
MAEQTQTLATHRRFIPAFHFFALPVLLANVFVVGYRLVQEPRLINGWALLVAIALAVGILWSRAMPLRAQDRIIRLEERSRLERLLPGDMRGRIGELTERQLIAIRFAPDDEVPELTRRTLDGELKSPGDIKRAIHNWRADHFRV